MGQAKAKRQEGFEARLVEEWEADDCVNFAIALARITGWLLHVDWWSQSTTYQGDVSVDQLKPLRVYVADNHDRIFDVRGVKTIVDFNERTISKIARGAATGGGGVLTRYYSEEKLLSLPLRSLPNEGEIARATKSINVHPFFLASIPERPKPRIPASDAARYTFGRCAVFAEAMSELTGLEPVAMLATQFSPLFEGTRRADDGYIHSVVMHADGMAEDAWGRASIDDIAGRFGALEGQISRDVQRQVVENLRRTSAEIYDVEYARALKIIRTHRINEVDASHRER
jgi:hypothetical protein